MPDFYDVKNNGKGAMVFGSRAIGPGETVPLYLTDEQYQKYNGLGWVVGVNSTVGNAYAVDGRYVSRSSVGTGTSGSGAGGSAQATDANLVASDIAADAVAGKWKELFPANSSRNGASIQNKDVAANIFIVQADTAPADGARAGETMLPAVPTYFKFDYTPRKRHFFRSTVSASVVTLNLW